MLKQRILTAAVLAPVMIGGVFFLESQWFAYFIGLIVVLAGWEWANLSGCPSSISRVSYTVALGFAAMVLNEYAATSLLMVLLMIATAWWLVALGFIIAYPKGQRVWKHRTVRLFVGVMVILPMWIGLVVLKDQYSQTSANILLIWLMFMVWGADVGAYIAGRAFGDKKLAPNVSPGKTWAGVFGGMATAFLVCIIAPWFVLDLSQFNPINWLVLTLMALFVVAYSVIGDLFESLLKRFRGIKDSSQLLPGHGGVLDRIDSLCAAVPVFVVFIAYFPVK